MGEHSARLVAGRETLERLLIFRSSSASPPDCNCSHKRVFRRSAARCGHSSMRGAGCWLQAQQSSDRATEAPAHKRMIKKANLKPRTGPGVRRFRHMFPDRTVGRRGHCRSVMIVSQQSALRLAVTRLAYRRRPRGAIEELVQHVASKSIRSFHNAPTHLRESIRNGLALADGDPIGPARRVAH